MSDAELDASTDPRPGYIADLSHRPVGTVARPDQVRAVS